MWRVEHAGEEPELSISERAELAQLHRDNQTLRMERELREFLKKQRPSSRWFGAGKRVMSSPISATSTRSDRQGTG